MKKKSTFEFEGCEEIIKNITTMLNDANLKVMERQFIFNRLEDDLLQAKIKMMIHKSLNKEYENIDTMISEKSEIKPKQDVSVS